MIDSEKMSDAGSDTVSSPDKKWETPKEIFDGTLRERLDQLVEEGSMSSEFAKERLERGLLIDQNLTNPAQQAIEFAEIGLEAGKKFRGAVDSARVEVARQIEYILREARQNLVDAQDDSERKRYGQIVEGLEAALVDFQAKIRKVKDSL